MMTRKNYVLLAQAIKEARTALLYASVNVGETERSVGHIASEIALQLKRDNARFDYTRFYRACGIPDEA
jgi:hypothetical protein